MENLADKIFNKLCDYIENYNNDYSKWYCGITNNIQERLFGFHKVSEDDDKFLDLECENSDDAREIEKAMLDLGCKGGEKGGNDETVYVYIYLITSETKEYADS